MKRVIGEAFRNGNAQLFRSRKGPRNVEQIPEIRFSRIRVMSSRTWRDRQQRFRDAIGEEFVRASRFGIAIRNAALEFTGKQQSVQNSFMRAMDAQSLQLSNECRLQLLPARAQLAFTKDQQIQTAH